MIVGKFVCSACGKDCTALYGFIMQKRTTLTGAQIQAVNEVQREFGKDEFVFCWSCVAKAFGAKTLAQKTIEINSKLEGEKEKKPFLGKTEKPVE